MAKNVALKAAIFESPLFQDDIAAKTGIHYSKLSRIIHGKTEPSDAERKAIARVLKRSVHDLFPEVAA